MPDKVKLTPALPKEDSQDDGLSARMAQILKAPKNNIIAVALLSCKTIEQSVESGAKTPKLEITCIEVLEGRDEALGMDLIDLYRQNRTGQISTRPHRDDAESRRMEFDADLHSRPADARYAKIVRLTALLCPICRSSGAPYQLCDDQWHSEGAVAMRRVLATSS
jgi:hypothetical protein